MTTEKLVLVVEDDHDIGELLRSVVEELVGARAIVAKDSEEALVLASSLRI